MRHIATLHTVAIPHSVARFGHRDGSCVTAYLQGRSRAAEADAERQGARFRAAERAAEEEQEKRVRNIVDRACVPWASAESFLEQHNGHAGQAIEAIQPTLRQDDPQGLAALFSWVDADGSGGFYMGLGDIIRLCVTQCYMVKWYTCVSHIQ